MVPILVKTLGSRLRAIALLVLTSAICIIAGCGPEMPSEYRSFFKLTPERQHEEMKKFPTNKQIDYYLVGMSYVHPPRIGLAEDIAERGEEALPVLIKRLREEKEESRQAHIMIILREMHLFHYNLKSQKEVIELLKEVTAKMKDPWWKERGEETLKVIMEDKVVDPQKELQRTAEELSK